MKIINNIKEAWGFRNWLYVFFMDLVVDIFDMLAFLVFITWLIFTIRFYIFNPFTVIGQSMEPNFHEWDFIIIDKVTHKYWQLHRWDVIVFVPPGKKDPLIKRIIWLSWETVKILNNKVNICNEKWVDCQLLDESYLWKWVETTPSCSGVPISDPVYKVEWWYFVMWDHRWHTTDSMCCFWLGCYDGSNYIVPDNYIIGKVYVRIFPNFHNFGCGTRTWWDCKLWEF